MSDALALRFLHDGGQQVEAVAGELAAFIESARRDVAVAIYDFHVSERGAAVARALQGLAARGVRLRVCDHDDHVPRKDRLVPRPPAPPEYVDSLGLDVRPVAEFGRLMHNKYVVVDGERVWTGSLNWTDDAFTRQENCIATVRSAAVAEAYLRDFDRLWERRKIEGGGAFDASAAALTYDGAEVSVRPVFCPGRGVELAAAIASRITQARERVLICSPVLTSGPILGALADRARTGALPVTAVVDGTQMRDVLRQWGERDSWKAHAFRHVAGAYGRKRSTPWPAEPHDYLHAKIVVCDDWASVGSFNHSRSGEENAENALLIEGAGPADALAVYVEEVARRYAAAAGDVW